MPASRLTHGPLRVAPGGACRGELPTAPLPRPRLGPLFGGERGRAAAMSRSGRQAKPRPAASHRAGARENGRAPSPPGSGGGSENRRAQRGTTSTVMPRAEGRPMSPRARLYYRSHNASRRPVAPLAEAGSYLNLGSEENGGERLSVGETGRRRRSRALAPFPGEWGLEGGSNEWREESSSPGSPASSAGVGLGWGRAGCPLPGKGAAWGWP